MDGVEGRSGKTVINGAIFDCKGSAINCGYISTIIVDNATILSAHYAVNIGSDDNSNIIINNISIDPEKKGTVTYGFGGDYGRGTLEINGGSGYVNNRLIYSYSANIIMNGGNFESASAGVETCKTFKMTGGSLKAVSSAIDNIPNKDNQRYGSIIIEKGTVMSTNSNAVNNRYGTLTIGVNDGKIENNNIILKGKETAVNSNVGFSYYEGTLIGIKDKVINGTYNIPNGVVVLKEIKEDNFQYLTLGAPTEPVAKIAVSYNPNVTNIDNALYKLENGYYYFINLQSAIDSCMDNVETKIELLNEENEKLEVLNKINVPSSKNIIIELNDVKIKTSVSDVSIENNGILKLQNSSENIKGVFEANGETLIKNNESATLQIDNIEINSAKRNIYNNGNLKINNSNVNNIRTYCNGDVKIENSIIGGINDDIKRYSGIEYKYDINDFKLINSTINRTIYVDITNTGLIDNSVIKSWMYIDNSKEDKINEVIIQGQNTSIENVYNNENSKLLIKDVKKIRRIYNAGIIETISKNSSIDKIYNGLKQPWEFGTGTIANTQVDNPSSKLKISAGTIGTITNYWNLEIINGNINNIINNEKGAVDISGDDTSIDTDWDVAIINNGTVNIKGGTIKSKNKNAIETNGVTSVINIATDSTYTGKAPKIQGGVNGIVNGTGTVTIGIKDGVIDFSTEIYGASAGVRNENGGTFNFYDGIINGSTGNSITGGVNELEDEYTSVIHAGESIFDNKTLDKYTIESGKEISVLERIDVVMLLSNGKVYTSFAKALEDAQDTDTLKLINNYTYTVGQKALTIEEGKTITTDLNGYNIKSTIENNIVNNGTVIIKGTRNNETSGEIITGKIVGTANNMIINNGNCTIESGVFEFTKGGTKTELYNLIYNTGSLTVKNGSFIVKDYSKVINNTNNGSVVIEDGSYSAESNSESIYTDSTNDVTINNGTFNSIVKNGTGSINIYGGGMTSSSRTIVNSSEEGKINIYDIDLVGQIVNESGTIEISGGYIEPSSYNTGDEPIVNNAGTVTITGGEITSGNAMDGLTAAEKVIVNKGTLNIGGTTKVISFNRWNQDTINVIANSSGTVNLTGNAEIACKGGGSYIRTAISVGSGTLNIGEEDKIDNNIKITSANKSTDVAVSVSAKGTVNYYSGTITGGIGFDRFVDKIPDGYQMIKTVESGNNVFKIGIDSDVVQVASNKYGSIKQAMENNVSGTVTLLKDINVVTSEKIEIPEGKEFVLDLNGHKITTYNKDTWISNFGKLTVTDSSQDNSGIITGVCTNLITNNGPLVINAVEINNTTNAIGNPVSVIKNTGSGTIEITGGNFKATQTAKIISSDGDGIINITGGNFNIAGTNDKNTNPKSYILYVENENAVINFSGGMFTGNEKNTEGVTMTRGGILNIFGDARIYMPQIGTYVVHNAVTINRLASAEKMPELNISGNASIEQGTVTVNGIVNITGGVCNRLTECSTVNITGGKSQYILRCKNVNVSENARIETDYNDSTLYGNAINGCSNVNISGGTIIGKVVGTNTTTTTSTTITITGGNITAKTKAVSIPKNCIANITGGIIEATEGVGIEVSFGTLTLGVDDGGTPGRETPVIIGATCGVQNTNGQFNFYDGIIKSDLDSDTPINSVLTVTPEHYGAVVLKDTNNKYAILSTVGNVENVAEVNETVFNDFVEAMSFAIQQNATVKLIRVVQLNETITIPAGKTVTIDLNGQSISGAVSGAMIVNNGTLNVIDSAVLEDNLYSSIENTVGAVIENNGTLKIGVDDGNKNDNSPRIIGIGNAVTGSGIVNKYDGQIVNR